jgi:hypothetical protein
VAIKLDRRTFLRGLGGTAIALPALEIMLDSHGRAYAGPGDGLPCRFMVAFHGQALGGDNDPVSNLLVPDIVGADYDLKMATETLANHGTVKNDISIVSGLRIPYNTGTGIPAAGWDTDFHIQAMGPLLSGVRNAYSGDNKARGPTADQVVADAIGGATTFASLHYQVQASWYLTDSAPYGRDILSYRDDGAGDTIAVPGQTSPRAAFDALFTGFVPPDPSEAQAKAYELSKRKSIIDLVRTDIDSLIPKLGQVDKIRMQRHLDEIRDLENLLGAIPPEASEQCMMLPQFPDDPPVGGDNSSAGGDSGFDVNKGYSDEATRAQAFADLIHMAFTCDLTRSASLLYTMAQSHMNVHPFTQIPYDLHEVGHSTGSTENVSKVIAWTLDLFGYLVAKLRDTPEGDGTVLDNCAIVFLFEAGHGWDPGAQQDNSTHSTENMACLVAGGAGGLVRGHHVVANGLHPVNVLISAMHAVGVEQNLGEVNGIVPGLFV